MGPTSSYPKPEMNSPTRKKKESYEIDLEAPFKCDCMIIFTHQCFHDDWTRILEALRSLNEDIDSFNPFHADKAIITIRDSEQARLICLNKGWVTVGDFTMKFEKWSPLLHASPKVIPSYGGWLNFRGFSYTNFFL